MHLYLELWKPRPAWHALPKAERDLYLAGLGPAIAGLQSIGIELLGFARQDTGVAHAADFTWIAAWRMPTQELALRLERAVIDAGFHDLFEQINARGEIVDPAVVLGEMGKA